MTQTAASTYVDPQGDYLPTHPALTRIGWDDDRTDVHGVTSATYQSGTVTYTCACGHRTGPGTDFDATAALISHALHSCADCHGPKPADRFPRCSPHAF